MNSRARIEDISYVDVTLEENEEIVTDYHDEDPPKSPVCDTSIKRDGLSYANKRGREKARRRELEEDRESLRGIEHSFIHCEHSASPVSQDSYISLCLSAPSSFQQRLIVAFKDFIFK